MSSCARQLVLQSDEDYADIDKFLYQYGRRGTVVSRSYDIVYLSVYLYVSNNKI